MTNDPALLAKLEAIRAARLAAYDALSPEDRAYAWLGIAEAESARQMALRAISEVECDRRERARDMAHECRTWEGGE